MPDFECCLNEVCESVISGVLGGSGTNSTLCSLAKAGVSFSDCSRRPQEFDDALIELFQPTGALVIEARILARFYRSQGSKYQRGDSLRFADEVERARQIFERNHNLS
jgi:hypothetical protein